MAQQYLRIAEVYEKAAADKMATPEQHRVAFAHKAEWFRLRAQVRAMKEVFRGPCRLGAASTMRSVHVPLSTTDHLHWCLTLNQHPVDPAFEPDVCE
jgi:hypothetical protein